MAAGVPFKPTDEQRQVVLALSRFGIPREQIAGYLGICKKTLGRHFKPELFKSKVETNLMVAKGLFHNAVEEGNVSAQIFWLKTQCKWTDREDEDEEEENNSVEEIKIRVIKNREETGDAS